MGVLALAAYPPATALLEQAEIGAFRYLADDSFYYLAVAARSVDLSFFSFDGVHPTNGFHPLWQWLLGGSFALLELAPEHQILFSAWTSVALVSLGTALFGWTALRLTGRPALALLAAAPGIYALLLPAFNPHVGSQWSFANGMESPLSVFFFGILLATLVKRDRIGSGARPLDLVGVSALLTLIALSRLDDIFLFAPFLLYVAASSDSRRDAVRRLALAAALPFAAIGGYLVYNLVVAGSLLPSSGASKAEPFWALARNGYAVLTTLAPFADWFGRAQRAWSNEAWRVTQMVAPALIAAGWLWIRPLRLHPGDGASWPDRLIGGLAVYTLLKTGYNFFAVSLWHQGNWYYPLCIMSFNLIAAVAIARGLDTQPPRRALRLPLASGAALLVVLLSANGFIDLKRRGDHHQASFDFWAEREATRELLEADCPGCGVLAYDDGIVAFSLPDTPTLNGVGLAMDAEALRARSDGRLLELAWSRGHRLLVSVNYRMPAVAYASRESLRAHLLAHPHFRGEDLGDWEFDVAFRSPASQVPFLRFTPREQ